MTDRSGSAPFTIYCLPGPQSTVPDSFPYFLEIVNEGNSLSPALLVVMSWTKTADPTRGLSRSGTRGPPHHGKSEPGASTILLGAHFLQDSNALRGIPD